MHTNGRFLCFNRHFARQEHADGKVVGKNAALAFHISLLFIAIISVVAGISSLLALRHQGNEEKTFWSMADSSVYFDNAQAIESGQAFGKMFRERRVIPVLLSVTGATHVNPWSFLYLQQIPHFFLPLLLAGISRVLFNNRWVSLLSAVLYVAYSPAREASRIVSTDFLHAFFCILAIYSTMKFWNSDSWRNMLFSAAGWVLAMLSRPTFMWEWALIAPISVWNAKKGFTGWRKSICHIALLMMVPIFFMGLNFIQCGVPTPSFAAFENIHCSLVPSIQTRLRNQAGDNKRISEIFAEQVIEQKNSRERSWFSLDLWGRPNLAERDAFARTYAQLKSDDRNYLLKHWRDAVDLIKHEAGELLFYSNWQWCGGGRGRTIFVLGALTGLLFVWCGHGHRKVALWLLLTLGLVLGPASCAVQLWWGRRVGLPADMLFLALCGGVLISWRRVVVLLLISVAFKALNMWSYDPALHAAILLLVVWIVFEGVVRRVQFRGLR